jgi:hypothetical protein
MITSRRFKERSELTMNRLVFLAIVACGSGSLAAAAAIQPPQTDAGLKVMDGSSPVLKAAAKGVQIYTCKATADDPTKFAFDAAHAEPDALLFGDKGEFIIHHYLNADPAGPAWEAKDGSKVIAKKLDPVQARPGTIPWLRLEAVGHDGNGLLSKVTFVQRVDTAGGVAPGGTCDPAKNLRVRVPYTATYYFYAPGK